MACRLVSRPASGSPGPPLLRRSLAQRSSRPGAVVGSPLSTRRSVPKPAGLARERAKSMSPLPVAPMASPPAMRVSSLLAPGIPCGSSCTITSRFATPMPSWAAPATPRLEDLHCGLSPGQHSYITPMVAAARSASPPMHGLWQQWQQQQHKQQLESLPPAALGEDILQREASSCSALGGLSPNTGQHLHTWQSSSQRSVLPRRFQQQHQATQTVIQLKDTPDGCRKIAMAHNPKFAPAPVRNFTRSILDNTWRGSSLEEKTALAPTPVGTQKSGIRPPQPPVTASSSESLNQEPSTAAPTAAPTPSMPPCRPPYSPCRASGSGSLTVPPVAPAGAVSILRKSTACGQWSRSSFGRQSFSQLRSAEVSTAGGQRAHSPQLCRVHTPQQHQLQQRHLVSAAPQVLLSGDKRPVRRGPSVTTVLSRQSTVPTTPVGASIATSPTLAAAPIQPVGKGASSRPCGSMLPLQPRPLAPCRGGSIGAKRPPAIISAISSTAGSDVASAVDSARDTPQGPALFLTDALLGEPSSPPWTRSPEHASDASPPLRTRIPESACTELGLSGVEQAQSTPTASEGSPLRSPERPIAWVEP